MSNTAPFLHIAYANNNTGTLDFTTTGGIERTYTGFYTDEYATDSSDPTKYKWLTNVEFKNKVNTHVAYADSSDGTVRFTTKYPNLNLWKNTKTQSYTSTGTTLNVSPRFYELDEKPDNIIGKSATVTFDYEIINSTGTWSGLFRPTYYFIGAGISVSNTQLSGSVKQFIANIDTTNANNATYAIAMSGIPAGIGVIVKNLKVEIGSTDTPYMPSSSELANSDYPMFVGMYNDYSTTDSSDPTKYTWLTNTEFKTKISAAAYAKSADGKDGFTTVYPNLNLLDGTKDFSGTWNNSTLWTDDGTYNGLKVRKRTESVKGTYKIWTVPTDGTYTFSAYVKSSGNNANVHGAFVVNGVRETDRTFGNNFDWKRDSLTRTLKAGDSIVYSYEMAGSAVDSTIWVAGYKIESGSIATPWTPSFKEIKDSDYPQYIGLPNVTNPTTFKDYEWTLLESIPKKILNTYVAYANSSNGVTDFTTTYPNLNLLSNSKFPGDKLVSPWGNYSNGGTVIISNGEYNYTTPSTGTGSGKQGGINYTDTAIMTTQKAYTWSAKVKGSGTIRITYQYTYTDGTTSSWIQGGDTTLTSDYVLAEAIIPPQTKAFTKVILTLYFQGTSTGSIKEPKLEEGSIATLWLPSASEVKDSDYPKFVGVYGDDSTTASQSPTAYKWSRISVPGPTPPDVDNLYILTMPTVKNINLTYGIGTLTTKPVTWLLNKPTLDVNQVLWYKSEITGIDNSVGIYYSNLVGGADLDDGDSPLDNTVVSMVLNNKIVNVPRDLALKLELLSQTSSKRDNELAQLIADTNDRITNIDMGSGQAGLNQEVIDRKNGDDSLGLRIDTFTGNINDLKTSTQTKFTNIEKQLGGFSVQGTKNSSLTRPSIVFNYSAYGSTLPDGSTDGGGRLYYQVPGDITYDVKELKFNYQTTPSFYDMDQITIWEDSWSKLYGGFPWRDTIITTTDIDTFYIDGMTTYYNHDGDLVIRGKVVLDGVDDWIGSMSNRGFKPDTVVVTIASDLKSVKSIRFTGDMGVIVMSINLGYSATSDVQRLGRKISFIGASPKSTLTTTGSWVDLNEKIPYGMRPINSIEISTGLLNNNNTVSYMFGSNSAIRIRQSANNANQYQLMGQVGWETLNQYPPINYKSNTAWNSR
nr:MAG TPA: Minor structural protein 4 [Caudoviricetes sp.]